MRTVCCVMIPVFAGLSVSCAHGPSVERLEIASEDTNFVLWISNQSYDVRRVRIQVWLDGEPRVDERLHIGWGIWSQHTWIEYPFKLNSGTHTIKAHVYKHNELLATMEQEFSVGTTTRWGILNFHKKKGGDGRFIFEVSNHEPGIV